VHFIEPVLALIISRVELHVEELAAYLPAKRDVFECLFINFAPLSLPYLQQIVCASILRLDLGLIDFNQDGTEVISIQSISDVDNAHNL
jgi:hypothetical protein